MKVSIITVCYNSEATIEDTVKSVLSQNHHETEYIIVDGKSTDDTLNIINKYRDQVDHFISEKDNGIYDAMNKGLALATGDVIGILNSDDLYSDQDVITNIVNTFKASGADAVYADLVYVDKKNTSEIKRYWKAGSYSSGLFKHGWMPPHPTFFVKKDIYDKFGKFNLQLKSAADYEIMLRFIHKHKIKVAYFPEVIIKMRAGGVSNVSIKNRLKANREDRLAWRINGLKPGLFTLYLKPLLKLGQFFRKRPA